MHPSTHGVLGLWATRHYPTKTLWAGLAALLGSWLADLPLAVEIAINKWKWLHFSQSAVISAKAGLAKEVGHFLLLWILLYGAIRLWERSSRSAGLWTARAFAVGGIWHILIDALSHGRRPSVNYLWPLSIKLTKLVGVWNYVQPSRTLLPKPEELIFDYALLFFFLWRLWKADDKREEQKAIAETIARFEAAKAE